MPFGVASSEQCWRETRKSFTRIVQDEMRPITPDWSRLGSKSPRTRDGFSCASSRCACVLPAITVP